MAGTGSSTTSPIKMLSIDDKTVTTDLDRAGYRKMGVFVRAAANYEEARKYLSSERIDLIVINMDYRPVDGCQICKHLKSQDETKHLPVVLTSVQTAAKVRNSALESGADLFVEQPLPRQYFIEKLKQLLEQKTRVTERITLHGSAEMVIDGVASHCPIRDLSNTGILLGTESDIADGSLVEISFDLPGQKKPIQASGEVVRTIRFANNQSGIGIRFVKFRNDSQKRLEKYVEKLANGESQMQYYL
jgi:two-component system cell cycle response regulator